MQRCKIGVEDRLRKLRSVPYRWTVYPQSLKGVYFKELQKPARRSLYLKRVSVDVTPPSLTMKDINIESSRTFSRTYTSIYPLAVRRVYVAFFCIG